MPDTPTPENTPTPPDNNDPKRSRSLINKAQSAELTLAGELAETAKKPEYTAALAAEEIDAAFITELTDLIDEANGFLTSAGGKTVEKKTTTDSEETLKKKLLAQIATVQARAKRKYLKTGDPQRAKYYIGQNIGISRTLLESASLAILTRLGTETLPGMTPAAVTKLKDARDAYVKVQTTQSGDQSGATTVRSQLEAKVKEVAAKRRQLQYAADAAWPSTEKVNAGVRTEFKIPPDRALK
ncbi:MAG: hypothetical protein WC661_19700 [Opitutaceae bacterium]|jgi:hypothetical protein